MIKIYCNLQVFSVTEKLLKFSTMCSLSFLFVRVSSTLNWRVVITEKNTVWGNVSILGNKSLLNTFYEKFIIFDSNRSRSTDVALHDRVSALPIGLPMIIRPLESFPDNSFFLPSTSIRLISTTIIVHCVYVSNKRNVSNHMSLTVVNSTYTEVSNIHVPLTEICHLHLAYSSTFFKSIYTKPPFYNSLKAC